jgi:iron-sulfur cluster assembly protein
MIQVRTVKGEILMVTITEAASNQVKALLAEREAGLSLRLYVKGGGCSGFSYGMALDQQKEDDKTYQAQGLTVLVDPESDSLLEGAEVDYLDSTMGAGFKINNPNAVSTCGCGSSFRTATEAGTPGSCE